ncbi:MAG TPA: hypothetical protein DCY93_01645 [Firmicutes bacterium]|nr:hypothetical protein [Bacillota bacterium]
MKKNKIRIGMVFTSMLLLTSCFGGGGSSSTPASSTKPDASSGPVTSSPVSTSSPTSTSSSQPTSTLSPTSSAPTSSSPTSSTSGSSSTSSSTPTIPTPVTGPRISVKLMSGAVEATPANMVEGAGALTLRAVVENLPNGVSADQVTYTISARSNSRLNILPPDASKPNEIQFTANMPGTEVIHIEAKVGDDTLKIDHRITITRNDAQYKTISTAAELKALLAQATITDKYMLTADINLNGENIKAATTAFNGVLDGNGHKISNFNIVGFEPNGAAGGLFQVVHGLIRCVEIEGNINVAAGFAGLVAKELGENGIIEDCSLSANNISEYSDPTWQRNAAVVSCVKGTIQNIVVRVLNSKSENQNKHDQILDIAAYLFDSKGVINNVYVNRNEPNLQKPFDPNGSGNTVVFEDFHAGLGDFSNSRAEDFDLDPTIWNLVNGKVPTLKKEGGSVDPTPDPDPTDINGIPVSEIPAGYNVYWNDEFTASTLNTNYWEHQTGDGSAYGIPGWGNSEAQTYKEKNTRIENGNLIITALRESADGKAYTSSRIRTANKVHVKYGRVEARMALPVGQGLWPAFWMLPESSSPYGAWPHSGEIDILEARGRLPGESTSALHYSDLAGNHQYQTSTYYFPTGRTIADYNTYAVEWDANSVKFMVNGNVYYEVANSIYTTQAAPDNVSAPFDQEFHILINFAIGGHFDGYKLPEDSFNSAELKVDYVRIYKKK